MKYFEARASNQGEQNCFKRNGAYLKFTLKFYSEYKFCFILETCYLCSNYNTIKDCTSP